MKRRALLLAAAACACAGAPPRRPFAEAALTAAREAGELDAATERSYWQELDQLSTAARTTLARHSSLAAGLSALLFQDRGFVREVDDTDLRFVLLPSVLRERRGSCVGLGTLFLAVTEALGITARGVLRPGHFHVRLEDGGAPTNVELLRRGEVMSDGWYEGRFPLLEGMGPEYGRPLRQEETIGIIEYNVGNQRRRERRIEAAVAAYSRAVRHFPGFAEAHASLGAAHHLLGQVDAARASYATAQRLNPHLPHLQRNLSLLQLERAEQSAAASSPLR